MLNCSDLPGPAHALLGFLTTTARRRKHTLVVTTTPAYWADELTMTVDDARMWRDDLIASDFIRMPETGRIEVIEPCRCNNLLNQKLASKKTHLSDDPGTASPSPSVAYRRQSAEGGAPYLGEGAEHTHTVNDGVKYRSGEDLGEWLANTERPSPRRGIEHKPVERWSGFDLACYFNKALAPAARSLGVRLGPGGFAPLQPMARNFALWFRQDDEMTSITVKAMIDRFMARLGEYTAEGQPAWKAFLARRQTLWASETEAERRDLSRDFEVLAAKPAPKAHRPSIEEMLAERQAYLTKSRRSA